jgi:hypothetical protein
VIGIDIIDVQVQRVRGPLSGRRHSVKGDPRSSRKSGDRLSAIADQIIARRDDAGERGSDGNAVDLRQDRVRGRVLPVAGDEDRDIVLIEARISGLSALLAKPFAASRIIDP